MADKKQFKEVEEGPYYKKDSPLRNSMAGEGTPGNRLILEGTVYDSSGTPLPGVWMDFWQANGSGIYDNSEYNLRGHQYTDDNGHYRLETVEPAPYLGRTPHIHVKLRPTPDSRIYTIQLYFPEKPTNDKDPLFEPDNVMALSTGTDGKVGHFDFIINEIK